MTRLGRWVDFKNDYKTMDPSFMETVWWVFKQLWDKDLVYQDFRVMPFSWRLSTSLSNFEANLDYRDVQDPTVTVKMPLLNEQGEPTDTVLLFGLQRLGPFLPNLAIAVGQEVEYVKAKKAPPKRKKEHLKTKKLPPQDQTTYIVAKELASKSFGKRV